MPLNRGRLRIAPMNRSGMEGRLPHAVLALLGAAALCVVIFYRVNFAAPVLWQVSGTSMLPTMEDGDREVAVMQDFKDVMPGEIVIFVPQGNWTNARYVVHRVIRGFGGRFVTRGDNNDFEDPGYLTASNYVATVKLIIKARSMPLSFRAGDARLTPSYPAPSAS